MRTDVISPHRFCQERKRGRGRTLGACPDSKRDFGAVTDRPASHRQVASSRYFIRRLRPRIGYCRNPCSNRRGRKGGSCHCKEGHRPTLPKSLHRAPRFTLVAVDTIRTVLSVVACL